MQAEKWFKTLEILAKHEGELITDYGSDLYTELSNAMPNESWLGNTGERSFFRDYQASWTNLGVNANVSHVVFVHYIGSNSDED